MPSPWKQVAFALGIFLTTAPLLAAEPQGRYARQLATECDALIQAAIRRPYGLAWDNVAPAAPMRGSTTPRHVTLGPLGTPSAGLLLLWSGELLQEARYQQAAIETARGLAASQASTGKIPLHAIFGPTPSGRDDPGPVPERAATAAALAFLLETAGSDQPKPDVLPRTTTRAAQWLARQQRYDAWPESYVPDPEAPHNTTAIIRLDNASYRNSTYAMLLLPESVDDRIVSRASGKAVVKLLNLRLAGRRAMPPPANSDDKSPPAAEPAADNPAEAAAPTPNEPAAPAVEIASISIDESSIRLAPLWSSAYRLDGTIDGLLEALPAGVDTSASRYALQTLLADYLITGERQDGLALDAGRQALLSLRQTDGTWKSFYRRDPATTAPAAEPSTQPSGSIFHPPPPPAVTSTRNLERTLDAIDKLKLIGRERYVKMIAAQSFTLKEQLAAAVCGFLDDPLTLDFPMSRGEIEPYLKNHESDWSILQGPIPEDLSPRLKRLWVLLLRAKLEQKLG